MALPTTFPEKPKPISNTNEKKSKTSTISPSPVQAKKISFSIVVISVPLLYVSLLHITPSSLLKDTKFWFLMSNAIILIIAADSGMFSNPDESGTDIYEEFTKHSRQAKNDHTGIISRNEEEEVESKETPCNPENSPIWIEKSVVVSEQLKPIGSESDALAIVRKEEKEATERPRKYAQSKSEIAVRNRIKGKEIICKSATMPTMLPEKKRSTSSSPVLEENEYSTMSDEELNKRVEEFITRFNREIRLQELRN